MYMGTCILQTPELPPSFTTGNHACHTPGCSQGAGSRPESLGPHGMAVPQALQEALRTGWILEEPEIIPQKGKVRCEGTDPNVEDQHSPKVAALTCSLETASGYPADPWERPASKHSEQCSVSPPGLAKGPAGLFSLPA